MYKKKFMQKKGFLTSLKMFRRKISQKSIEKSNTRFHILDVKFSMNINFLSYLFNKYFDDSCKYATFSPLNNSSILQSD